MSIDIDIIKARAKNEYRLSKVRGEAMISVASPSNGCTAWARKRSSLEKGISRINEMPAIIRWPRRIKISI
ncbi:hypothetical protein ONR49_25935, partial [Salmonella enterica subsp. enterica serovar Virginia]|nr:hypothetical protein [Salmonella enterica subsp. enterica serovar Virginia]